jgi:hypothetical protein
MTPVNQPSLTEFVRYLAVSLNREGRNMPLENQKHWHILFYKLKKKVPSSEDFKFLSELRFDWDGHYPKCRELSAVLGSLHRHGCGVAQNPTFSSIHLSPDVIELWGNEVDVLSNKYQSFVTQAKELALREFPTS